MKQTGAQRAKFASYVRPKGGWSRDAVNMSTLFDVLFAGFLMGLPTSATGVL
jgi:hypothetical protein